jgi:hypothetical protein
MSRAKVQGGGLANASSTFASEMLSNLYPRKCQQLVTSIAHGREAFPEARFHIEEVKIGV